jgi:hypothetical protein
MTIPMPCQPIADEIEELEAKRADLQELLSETTGQAKWKLLQQIAAIKHQIAGKQEALDRCVLANAPGYRTEITVFDLAGSTVLPYHVQQWQLTPPSSQGVFESRDVVAGSVTFANGASFPTGSIGISVHDAPGSIFPGVLFRSGPMAALPPGSPGDPAGLIEIGVPAVPPVPLATIVAGFPALPMTTAISTSLGTLSVRIASLTLTLAPGSATLTVGLIISVIFGPFGTTALPFTYTLPFTIVPSSNMNDVTEICLVVPSGPDTVTAPPGPLDLVVGPILPLLAPRIRPVVVSTLQTSVNGSILSAAAGAVGLTTLPAGVVVSMRRVVIATGGIVFFPALGAYGGLLNKITLP